MTPDAREPYFLVTRKELDQIKSDCAYPEIESCIGCPLADGEDDTRASGMGCNFKGANALMEEVLSRTVSHTSAPAQQPASKLLKAIISECQGEVDCELRGNAKDLAKRILYYIECDTQEPPGVESHDLQG